MGVTFKSDPSITFLAPSTVLTVSGNNGSPLFSIKPNGEFVPGPGIEETSISEFAKVFYKQMTIFGKTFAETLELKEMRIKELESEILKLKNGTQD